MLLVIVLPSGFPFEGRKQSRPSSLFVSCDTDPSRPPKKVEVSSPIMISRNGSNRAWVQVTSNPQPAQCFNTTSLWIQANQGKQYRAYRETPVNPYKAGNGMQLIDWSPNGELLLAELWRWNTMPNDAGVDKRILVFQPRTDRKYEISLEPLVADQKDKDCFVEFKLLGFTDKGWVALKADIRTDYDEEETPLNKPMQKRCAERTQMVAIDPVTQNRESLPMNFRVARNSLIKNKNR